MRHRIDPTVDCVFKAVLGQEENKNLLIHFLNAILKPKGADCIQDVVIVNPYNEREFQSDKLTVVDIKAHDQQNRMYQIEIQIVAHIALAERILYTWSTLYHASIKKGQPFEELKPVVAIWLLKEALFAEIDAYHLPFVPYNIEHDRVLSTHQAIHVVQLPKWHPPQERLDEIDRWMYFFTEGKDVDSAHLPDILETQEMEQAMQVLERFSESEKNYLLYEQRLEAERLEVMWQRLHTEAERSRAEAERSRAEVERSRAETERLRAKTEQAEAMAKQAREEAEQERRDKERFLALLRQAGINPDKEMAENDK